MVYYNIKGVRISEGELDTISKLILVYRCLAGRWPSGLQLKEWLKHLDDIVD